METLHDQVKRKKRKTRRCLDEMRKRSRTSVNDENNSKNINNVKQNVVCNKQRNCITTGRLTLKMFPKAVCSETITRPILVSLKQPCLDNKNCDVLPQEKTNVIQEYNFKTLNNCHGIASVSEKSVQIVNFSDTEENFSDNLVLFSPIYHPSSESSNYEKSTYVKALSTSSNSSTEGDTYYVYQRFMDGIPGYIGNNYPELNKEEYITNALKQLHNIQNLHRGELHQPSKNNIYMKYGNSLMKYKIHNKEQYTENPIDYIRLGCLQNYSNRESSSDSDTSVTGHCLRSPYTSSPNVHSILSQTPDYAFYPHKLNE